MIFLSSGVSIWRSIQRASAKALEHPEGQSHNDELDAYFLALGWVLVAIGIYFLYQWLFSSPREEIAGAERPLPARSESRGPAIVLLYIRRALVGMMRRLHPEDDVREAELLPENVCHQRDIIA